jgi:hypothetical protein
VRLSDVPPRAPAPEGGMWGLRLLRPVMDWRRELPFLERRFRVGFFRCLGKRWHGESLVSIVLYRYYIGIIRNENGNKTETVRTSISGQLRVVWSTSHSDNRTSVSDQSILQTCATAVKTRLKYTHCQERREACAAVICQFLHNITLNCPSV